MDDPAGEIGKNIRARRRALSLSLEALAKRSGVSPTMLSEVERAVKNPTVKLAYQIARALGCTLTDLLSESPMPTVTVVRADERRRLVEPDTRVTRWGIRTALLDEGLEVAWYELPPKSSSGEMSANRAGVVEMVNVIDGALTLVLGGDEHVLEKDDSAMYAPSAATEYRNDAPRKKCRFLLLSDSSKASRT
ncbi:MAG: XRE family transcriptional regulator [Myxococcota bacterium]